MEDNYKLKGNADSDSIYGGAQAGRRGFRCFLSLVERRDGLLPLGWSLEKEVECEAVSMNYGWSSLANAIGEHDIIQHYGSSNMPMQLKMFGEQVYKRGPGGQNGAKMMQVQMVEGGEIYIDGPARVRRRVNGLDNLKNLNTTEEIDSLEDLHRGCEAGGSMVPPLYSTRLKEKAWWK